MKDLKFKVFIFFVLIFVSVSLVNGINLDKIVFVRDGDIYTMNSDGSNQIDITNSPANDREPDWSPDGTKIVFVKNNDISIMNSDGSNIVQLTYDGNTYGGNTVPDWSPDGTKIAFLSNRDLNNEVYVMNSDGSNQIDLSNNPAVDHYAAWSPDGTKIAFTSTRDGNNEIYVMNPDGTDQTRLTNIPGDDFDPAWSPDGTKIVFASTRDGGNYEIYLMNADGTNPIRLTNIPAHDYYPAWSPDWSPDGTKIIFDSLRDGRNEIYVMNPDGTDQTRLTFDGGSYPDWIYISSQGIDGNNCIYNAELTNPLGLTWDGTNFWYSDEVDKRVYKIGTDGSILGSFTGPGGTTVHGLAWDGTYLWLVRYGGNLYKINTAQALIDGNTNNAIIQTISSPTSWTEAMTYDNNNLYLYASGGNSGQPFIYKIDSITGEVVGQIDYSPWMENRVIGCSWKDTHLLCSFLNGAIGEFISIKEIDVEKALVEGTIDNSIVAEYIPPRGEAATGVTWISPKIYYSNPTNGRICQLGYDIYPSVLVNPNNLEVSIDGSTDLTQEYSGTLNVILRQASKTVAEFNYDFSQAPLNLVNLIINEELASATKAYIILKGMELQEGNTKTLHMNRLNTNLNYVCVKDADINDISEISYNCQDSNEYLVPCNRHNFNGYTCTKTATEYVITGLKHSGVTEHIEENVDNPYYWMDTNGDGYLGGDDLADVYNLNDGLITEFNFNGLICPVTIWDLNGDGIVDSNDYILDIAQEIANTGMYSGVIAGSPRKLTLRKEANGDYIAKVTTDSAVTGFPEVGRACIEVDINGEKYFTDDNGEVRISGETAIMAIVNGNENKQIPYMEESL